MSTVKKNYSIYVHALHSRLQMIRNKLDAHPAMNPSDMVIRNMKYFEKAGQSVETYHQFRCGRSEYYDAAELFLSCLDPEEARIKGQPMWSMWKKTK